MMTNKELATAITKKQREGVPVAARGIVDHTRDRGALSEVYDLGWAPWLFRK